MKIILSMNDLASRIGIPRIELETVADEIDRHYRSWQKRYQKTGKVRMLHAPSPRLKEIQRRITRHILIPIQIARLVARSVTQCQQFFDCDLFDQASSDLRFIDPL